MNYRRMGKSGLRLSEISYGAWVTFGDTKAEETQEQCMTAAYEAGVNFFDNAEAYAGGQAEVVMGRILKNKGWRREGLVLSTKIYWGGRGPNDTGLSHKHIIEGVNNALRRLQVEYVDLLYCHRPDPNTPIEETVRAIDILIKQGKVFYWGTSEWSAADILRADAIARQCGLTPPSVEQPQYNLLHRRRMEGEYLPLFRDLGYGTTIWSPLASGVLTGKYNGGVPAGTRLSEPSLAWLKDTALSSERLARVRAGFVRCRFYRRTYDATGRLFSVLPLHHRLRPSVPVARRGRLAGRGPSLPALQHRAPRRKRLSLDHGGRRLR